MRARCKRAAWGPSKHHGMGRLSPVATGHDSKKPDDGRHWLTTGWMLVSLESPQVGVNAGPRPHLCVSPFLTTAGRVLSRPNAQPHSSRDARRTHPQADDPRGLGPAPAFLDVLARPETHRGHCPIQEQADGGGYCATTAPLTVLGL